MADGNMSDDCRPLTRSQIALARFRDFVKKHRLTHMRASKLMGVSLSTVGRFLNCNVRLSERHITAIELLLGADTSELIPSSRLTNRPRARTVSMKRLSKAELDRGRLLFPDNGETIPQTRAACEPGGENEQRPCPYVRCKYHLYLDVDPRSGSIKLNFPKLEVSELTHSCALDIAKENPDGVTLEDLGKILMLTRERIRQIEARSLKKIGDELNEQMSPDEAENLTSEEPQQRFYWKQAYNASIAARLSDEPKVD